MPFRKPVPAPLPDVTMHVVQPESIRLIGANCGSPFEIWRLVGAAVRPVAVEIGLLWRRRLPIVAGRDRAGPARVLPLRLGRQPIDAPSLPLLRQFRQLLAKGHGIVPG